MDDSDGKFKFAYALDPEIVPHASAPGYYSRKVWYIDRYGDELYEYIPCDEFGNVYDDFYGMINAMNEPMYTYKQAKHMQRILTKKKGASSHARERQPKIIKKPKIDTDKDESSDDDNAITNARYHRKKRKTTTTKRNYKKSKTKTTKRTTTKRRYIRHTTHRR